MRLLPFAIALFASAAASAQSPSRGVRLPFPAVSLGDDASGVDVNPAGLGFVRGLDAQILGTSLSAGVGGSGEALYVASPIIGPFSLGLGVQHIATQTLGTLRFDDYARLSLSAAFAPSDRFSFGLSVHSHFSDLAGLGDFTTLDLGLLWRPGRWISLGAAVQDLTTPRVGVLSLHRAWVLGMGLRPGTERVFVGADVRIEEVARRVDPVFRVALEPVRGLLLGGSVEVRDRDLRTEVTAQLGLTWRFDLSGTPLRGALGYSSWLERGFGHDGFTVQGRFYRAREAALPEPTGRFVKVHLKGGIPEQAAPPSLFTVEEARWTTARALDLLRAALRDERVAGVVVAFDEVSIGLAQAEEIRAALLRLRRAGKRVFAHLNGASNATYLAATGAERVYLSPVTTLNIVGFASSVVFLRGLLDKVGVLPEFVAEGKYKSAPEQFTRKSMSDPARAARLAFLGDAYDRLVATVAEARRKPLEQVRTIVDRAPLTARDAVREGLADGVAYLDQLEKILKKERIRVAYLPDPGAPARSRWSGYPRVAVVHVEGTIAEGKSFVDPIFRRKVAGADTIAEAIRRARLDRRVRAVVLRVNSPGGSMGASERIWREVVETRKVKPVVASFGNIAASGGYYVAAPANEIFADPTTLTGSIGVFFGKFSLSGLFGKLDLAAETVRRGKRADLLSLARPWTDEERRVIRRLVRDAYGQFVDRVSQGRRLGSARVDAVAKGRIWSGAAALRHKLVDRLGGLDEAIERAKELAGISPDERVALVELPRPGFFARLLRRLRGGGAEAAARAAGVALHAVSSPLLYLRPGEPWAILPFEIDLR
jgi:protease-4